MDSSGEKGSICLGYISICYGYISICYGYIALGAWFSRSFGRPGTAPSKCARRGFFTVCGEVSPPGNGFQRRKGVDMSWVYIDMLWVYIDMLWVYSVGRMVLPLLWASRHSSFEMCTAGVFYSVW